jgi:hypothetical protein
MKFEEALKCMREGKKVKLPDYNTRYCIINGSIWEESINSLGHVYYAGGIADLSCHKILAEDWEVIEDDNK